MKKLLLSLAVALTTLAPLHAAENIHVFITGAKSGPISGENDDKSIAGLAFEHSIVVPRDASTGLPTGKRQHKPFTLVKAIDASTPLLYSAATTNQNLTTVSFQFYRPSATGGKPELYYTVTLVNASIASIRNWKPNTRDLSADRAGDLEEVSFTYQKITWTYAKGGITASDDWTAPSA